GPQVVGTAEGDALAYGTSPGPRLSAERLVDDDHQWTIGRIAGVEQAPAAHRNAHRFEVPGGHDPVMRDRAIVAGGPAFDAVRPHGRIAAERYRRNRAGGCDGGHRTNPIERLVVEGGDAAIVRVPRLGQR